MAFGVVIVVAMPLFMVFFAFRAATAEKSKGKSWKVLDATLAVISTPILATLTIFKGLAAVVHPGVLYRKVSQIAPIAATAT